MCYIIIHTEKPKSSTSGTVPPNHRTRAHLNGREAKNMEAVKEEEEEEEV